MSILGKIGKFASFAAPIAAMAIPGLQGLGVAGLAHAGILGTAGKIAGALSPVLGGMAKDRGAAQQQDSQDQIKRDQLNLEGSQMGLDAAKFNSGSNSRILRDYMSANMARSPIHLNWGGPGSGSGTPATPTGGYMDRPEGSNDLMDELTKNIMAQKASGGYQFNPTFTGATAPPKSGVLDKTLGMGAGISSILGALGPLAGRRKPAVSTDPNRFDLENYG